MNEEDRTEVSTFRLPRHRIRMLKQEARNQQLTANALANKIIGNYFDFNLVASSSGMMPFPKMLLKAMIDQLEDEEIAALCKSTAQSELLDLVYVKRNEFTLETFLDTMLTWMRFSGFPYNETFDDEKRIIAIHHNMGAKWSRFMKGCLELVFSKLAVRTYFEGSDGILIITIHNEQFVGHNGTFASA